MQSYIFLDDDSNENIHLSPISSPDPYLDLTVDKKGRKCQKLVLVKKDYQELHLCNPAQFRMTNPTKRSVYYLFWILIPY